MFSLLCPEAQSSLVTAEQVSRFRDLGDPSVVVVEVAKAFESQLETSFLEPFCDFLVKKRIQYYGVESRPPLLKGWRLNDRWMLVDVATLLDSGLPEVEEFAASRGFSIAALIAPIREVAKEGGKAKHRNAFPLDGAKRLKEKWVRGVPFGKNIFAPLVKLDALL